MLKNYLKIAVRNLLKYKLTSFINLFGLAVGLTCCLAIVAYALNELSFDKFHSKADRIYRVTTDWKWTGGSLNAASTSGPVAPLLKQNFPEVENTVRFFAEGTEFVKSGENTVELSPIFTENSFFKIFDYTFLYGDPKSALSEPNSMILSESAAVKIFGNPAGAYGKTLEYINRPPQKVTGIIKDVPQNSHLVFNAVGALDTQAEYLKSLQQLNVYTYVLLKKGTDVHQLEQKISKLMGKELNDTVSSYRSPFQPLTSIHLHSHLTNEVGATGNIQYLYIFSIVGAIILLLACINYINLATAQSSRRAKEVGVRKVIGSDRGRIILQFFTESFLLVILAALFSLLILQLITPFLTKIGGEQISLWNYNWHFIAGVIIGFALIVGILSGIYPAVYLSGFRPATILKGVTAKSPSTAFFRKSLVVVQFTISIALIAFTVIVWQQLNYALNKDLGFNKDQVLGIRIPGNDLRIKNLAAFKSKLSSYPGILATTVTTNPLGKDGWISTGGFFFETDGQRPSYTNISQQLGIDPAYFKMMGISLKEGRNFSAAIPSDSAQSLIVNETLVKKRGWKNPLGKRIWYFTDDNGSTKEAKVIGVVKDFHVESLHKNIEPLLFYLAPPEQSDNLYIKLRPENIRKSLAYVQKTYREFDNYNPFETYFLDENFASQYQDDNQKRNLFLLFASLAIVIACLGLFGLAAFTIEQRTKEIGIRKVLGASIKNVLVLVTKDFVWLVCMAFVIAVPIAWWGMNKWLQDFAYKIPIHWWTFAIAGILAVLVAVLTISFQAMKAAIANPVKSLRTE
ncbi:ABC transporter permease [Rubrolithibacter danxiaensis]|uniref:ABC transporter permease n=1 Tax=Rubrolithibacter danxiaensis TaxID=3390805 RepID=UPI003BF8E048